MPPGIVKSTGTKPGKGSRPMSQMMTPITPGSSGNVSPAEPDGLRLCQLSKWLTYEGYGFGLREDRSRKAHVIDHVEARSPAEYGGLRERDRIVQVNGVPVRGKTLKEVIELIKKDTLKVDLLVVGQEADDAFGGRKQTPSKSPGGAVRQTLAPKSREEFESSRKKEEPGGADRFIVELEDTSSGEVEVTAEPTRDERGKLKKPAKPPLKPTAKGGKGGPVPVAPMSKAEQELRRKHKDVREAGKDYDTTSISTLEGSEQLPSSSRPRASGSGRRSSQSSQDSRGMDPPPWNTWDADTYGQYYNPTADVAGGYGWPPPPDSWPTPLPPPPYNPGAPMVYSTGTFSPPYFATSPSPYMPYQAPTYWPSPYATFVPPMPFYGYGYPPWGMDYPFYSGYGGYEQPGGSKEPASGREAAADRPSTSKGRRHGSRRASNVSDSEYSDVAGKARADKPEKKPPKDESRKRL